ncbi:MAG: HAD-IIB family hydrolase [Deltaproteobacteria bacterium]|nr:HAD-IIB family hydrolase [Deltaproteobacteria bacterium]
MIIFTDLDGTLLNHKNYSYAEALASLERIRQQAIPLIMTTSKTRSETRALQLEMGIDDPFIVENGAAICFPEGYRNFQLEEVNQPPFAGMQVIRLGISYDRIRAFIEEIRDQVDIKGFGDLSVEEISGMTGLTLEKAKLAKKRQYTEPFIMTNENEISMLQDIALGHGLRITMGGRFYHMIGTNQDKGKAVNIVRNIFNRNTGKKHLTIGLGDSINDLPMLKSVDIPVYILNPETELPEADIPGLIRSESTGSKGWNDTILELLDRLYLLQAHPG